MVEFTVDFLTSWRLERYTHVTCLGWSNNYVTICPHREELPISLRVLLSCDCFPIYSPVVDEMAKNELTPPIYFVSDNYDFYRHFDEEYIDSEADF